MRSNLDCLTVLECGELTLMVLHCSSPSGAGAGAGAPHLFEDLEAFDAAERRLTLPTFSRSIGIRLFAIRSYYSLLDLAT